MAEQQKYKLKFKGNYPILLECPGFVGTVKPGDEIEVLRPAFDELRGHDDWVAVAEKKDKKTEVK